MECSTEGVREGEAPLPELLEPLNLHITNNGIILYYHPTRNTVLHMIFSSTIPNQHFVFISLLIPICSKTVTQNLPAEPEAKVKHNNVMLLSVINIICVPFHSYTMSCP